MSVIATYEIQAGLRARLLADATLVALVPGGMHDGSAPSDARKPYIVFGDMLERSANIHTRIGRELDATITIWSDYQGKKEAVDIADRLVALLENTTLTTTNWHAVLILFDSINYGTDALEVQQRATLRFRLVAQP
jgi:hypothetical protein